MWSYLTLSRFVCLHCTLLWYTLTLLLQVKLDLVTTHTHTHTRPNNAHIQVVDKLKDLYGDLYDENNVLISGIHTHSGPAGFFQYFLFEVNSLKYSKYYSNCDVIAVNFDMISPRISNSGSNMYQSSVLCYWQWILFLPYLMHLHSFHNFSLMQIESALNTLIVHVSPLFVLIHWYWSDLLNIHCILWFKATYLQCIVINPRRMHSEGYSSLFVTDCLCLQHSTPQ